MVANMSELPDETLPTLERDYSNDRLVKSTERVRDLGEVFTPANIVNSMLDLLPSKIWAPHPSRTFFEPSCGDGNFLIAILERKLDQISADFESLKLPAGHNDEALEFHSLEALASIYAVDISPENILGGTPGHHRGARTRLMEVFVDWIDFELGKKVSSSDAIVKSAQWIVDHNILIANMLAIDADGRATGREAIPIIEYSFDAITREVSIGKTTFGDIQASAEQEVAMELSLFGPQETQYLWSGPALQLSEADPVIAPVLRGPTRNGATRL